MHTGWITHAPLLSAQPHDTEASVTVCTENTAARLEGGIPDYRQTALFSKGSRLRRLTGKERQPDH